MLQPKQNGGKREGAGRKPKADEIKLIEMMDAILAPEEAWRALANKVTEGDSSAQKTWLNYRFGIPKQIIALEGGDKPIEISFLD